MKSILDAAQEDRWLSVTEVFIEGRNLTIRFETRVSGSQPALAWFVSCRTVRDLRLTDFDGGGLNLWRGDHPVAWQFSSPKASLTIDVGTQPRTEYVGMLFAAHRNAVDDWIDFDRFVRLDRLLKSASRRVLLTGPAFLLAEYHKYLTRSGFPADLKKYKRKLYWSGVGWSQRSHKVSVLHFGNSFRYRS